ncbi:MAG: hypothetical protein AAGJ35_02440, partial [Myxococcota bacterium]
AGQLGLGDFKSRAKPEMTPVDFQGKKVQQVDNYDRLFLRRTCAILENGALYCWGHALLGYGDSRTRNKPDTRPINFWGKKVLQVAMSAEATCALLEDSRLHCWGTDKSLQGYGDKVKRLAPTLQSVDFRGLGVQQVSMHHVSACALLKDGSVSCWGSNHAGQLGYGDRTRRSKPGPRIPLVSKARWIGVGGGYTCVLLEKGWMKCWGFNREGQLGYADQQLRLQPDQSALDFRGRRVVQSSLENEGACAVMDDKSMRCWGRVPIQRPLEALRSPLSSPLLENATRP